LKKVLSIALKESSKKQKKQKGLQVIMILIKWKLEMKSKMNIRWNWREESIESKYRVGAINQRKVEQKKFW